MVVKRVLSFLLTNPDVAEYWYIWNIILLSGAQDNPQTECNYQYLLLEQVPHSNISKLILPKSSLNLLLDLCYLEIEVLDPVSYFLMEITCINILLWRSESFTSIAHATKFLFNTQKLETKNYKKKKQILLSLG